MVFLHSGVLVDIKKKKVDLNGLTENGFKDSFEWKKIYGRPLYSIVSFCMLNTNVYKLEDRTI